MSQPVLPRVLVLDDDEAIRTFLTNSLGGKFEVVLASTIAEALRCLESAGPFGGAILDVGLPDGLGTEVLHELRAHGNLAPALVLTSSFQPEVAAAAQIDGAEFLAKPYNLFSLQNNLEAFGARIFGFARSGGFAQKKVLDAMMTEFRLSKREFEILALSLDNHNRRDMIAVFGTSLNTLKTQIRSLLRKTDCESLAALSRRVRAGVLPS